MRLKTEDQIHTFSWLYVNFSFSCYGFSGSPYPIFFSTKIKLCIKNFHNSLRLEDRSFSLFSGSHNSQILHFSNPDLRLLAALKISLCRDFRNPESFSSG